MSEHVYRVTEIVGTSTEGCDDAWEKFTLTSDAEQPSHLSADLRKQHYPGHDGGRRPG